VEDKKEYKMKHSGRTSEIGEFVKGQVIPLPAHIGRDAVKAGIAREVRPVKPRDKKGEVKSDGTE